VSGVKRCALRIGGGGGRRARVRGTRRSTWGGRASPCSPSPPSAPRAASQWADLRSSEGVATPATAHASADVAAGRESKPVDWGGVGRGAGRERGERWGGAEAWRRRRVGEGDVEVVGESGGDETGE